MPREEVIWFAGKQPCCVGAKVAMHESNSSSRNTDLTGPAEAMGTDLFGSRLKLWHKISVVIAEDEIELKT
jgi:hypothetical protein